MARINTSFRINWSKPNGLSGGCRVFEPFSQTRNKRKTARLFFVLGFWFFFPPRLHSFCACVSRKSPRQPTRLPQRLMRDWKIFASKTKPPQTLFSAESELLSRSTPKHKKYCNRLSEKTHLSAFGSFSS